MFAHRLYKKRSRDEAGYLSGIICFVILQLASSLELETCKNALGMESGSIADFQITASSAHDMGNVGPQHARLKIDNNGGAWCPKHMVSRGLKEYLQIDLLKVHVITAVRTQGRFGKGQGQEYTEAYVLEYWRPGMTKWIRWKNIQGKEILTGNINTYSEVENLLQPIIFASKIRIYPYSQYDRTVCMRAELIGCLWQEGIASYTIPKGVQRGMEIDLSDKTYDGHEEDDKYVDGLGQLVDGQKGKDNFRTDIHGFGKGYEWVGWRNDTPNLLGKPVEIVFEFDTVRNFSAILLHTNNMFSKDVQVFVHAKVYFSIGGRYYTGQPVLFTYMPDTVLDHARDVTIKLHHRVGRFVRVRLYFALRWIMLSEISFVSAPIIGNFSEEEVEAIPTTDMPLPRDGTITKSDYNLTTKVIAPRPIDQDPEDSLFGVIIGVLTTIILLLVVVILLIIARNKRKAARGSNVLDVFQQNFHSDTLNGVSGVKRMQSNSNAKVNLDDSDSIDKNSMYHEPFNVNMYTSAASACSMNDIRHHPIASEYTEVSDAVCQEYPHMQNFIPKTSGGYVNVRSRPPQSFNNIFPKPPPVPVRANESYYAATAIYRPISNGSGNGSAGGTGFSASTGTIDSTSTIPEMSMYLQSNTRTYNFNKFPDNL